MTHPGLTISKWWVARAARPPVFVDVCGKRHLRQILQEWFDADAAKERKPRSAGLSPGSWTKRFVQPDGSQFFSRTGQHSTPLGGFAYKVAFAQKVPGLPRKSG